MMWRMPDAFTRLRRRERTIDDRMAELERHVPRRLRGRQLRLPQVLRDAVAPAVALADPHDPALVVDLVGLAVAALAPARDAGMIAAALVELAAPDVAVAVAAGSRRILGRSRRAVMKKKLPVPWPVPPFAKNSGVEQLGDVRCACDPTCRACSS